MCAAALRGDFETADALDLTLQDLHRDLFVESNPIPVKYAVSKLGFGANVLRLPLTKLAVENQGFIDAGMSKVELC
jgi:4-hydroxy-tetrahydrodipicolinate synthase